MERVICAKSLGLSVFGKDFACCLARKRYRQINEIPTFVRRAKKELIVSDPSSADSVLPRIAHNRREGIDSNCRM
jgi:hypothetical protein